MKATVIDEYGSPDVLELKEIDRPPVNDDEVLAVLLMIFGSGRERRAGVCHLRSDARLSSRQYPAAAFR